MGALSEQTPPGPPRLPAGVPGKSLLPTEGMLWHEAVSAPSAVPAKAEAINPEELEKFRVRGEELLAHEMAVFDRDLHKRNAADYKWLKDVWKAGTTKDKVAAATVLVQSSAAANLKALDTLISWVQKRGGGRDVVRHACLALTELFTQVLLPDRKLRFLQQQPLSTLPDGREGDKLLLGWYLEHSIKNRYMSFVSALESCSTDHLEFLKECATKSAFELLSSKPEQEARLLSLLVNKLGDPARKVASNAAFLLSQLLVKHPAMKLVVVKEVETFVFRPNLSDRARYYAVVFLNQMVLTHKAELGGPALAKRLIDLYFTLFRLILDGTIGNAAEAKRVDDEKRAKEKKKSRWKQGKGQAGKGGKGGKGGKAKPPPPKVKKASKPQAETMDARMLAALVAGVRRAFPYVAAEEVEPLVDAQAMHLFRIIHVAPFSVALQALLLLFQLMSSRSTSNDRFYRALYSVLLSFAPTASSKASLFLGLLFKAMKADVSVKRVSAFAKRLLQLSLEAPPNFAVASLFLLSEVLKASPALWAAMLQPEDAGGLGEEHFVDAEEASDPEAGSHSEGEDEEKPREGEAPKRRKLENGAVKKVDDDGAAWPPKGYYDMKKREPLYCGAEKSCWWEMGLLAQHYQPSVSAMARSLLAGAPVEYNGDPLKDHSTSSFLDKFVQKKPKAGLRGSSAMQPLTGKTQDDGPSTIVPPGSEAFAALAESTVAPDMVFFHRYYNLQSVQSKQAAKKAKKGDAEESEEDMGELDEEDEMEVDALLDREQAKDTDRGDGVYDYAQLLKAMRGDKTVLGSDEDTDAESDEEEEDEHNEGVEEDEGKGAVRAAEGSDDDVPSSLDIGDLPSPSDSDNEPEGGKLKRHRANIGSDDDDDDQSFDSDDDSGEDLVEGMADDDEDDGEAAEAAKIGTKRKGKRKAEEVVEKAGKKGKQKPQTKDVAGDSDNDEEIREPDSAADDSDLDAAFLDGDDSDSMGDLGSDDDDEGDEEEEEDDVGGGRGRSNSAGGWKDKKQNRMGAKDDFMSDFAPAEDYEHLMSNNAGASTRNEGSIRRGRGPRGRSPSRGERGGRGSGRKAGTEHGERRWDGPSSRGSRGGRGRRGGRGSARGRGSPGRGGRGRQQGQTFKSGRGRKH